jgi:hypothetical protein
VQYTTIALLIFYFYLLPFYLKRQLIKLPFCDPGENAHPADGWIRGLIWGQHQNKLCRPAKGRSSIFYLNVIWHASEPALPFK